MGPDLRMFLVYPGLHGNKVISFNVFTRCHYQYTIVLPGDPSANVGKESELGGGGCRITLRNILRMFSPSWPKTKICFSSTLQCAGTNSVKKSPALVISLVINQMVKDAKKDCLGDFTL